MKLKIISLFILCLTVVGLQAQIDRSKQPEPGPAPKINLGKPQSFTLNNGLKVMVVENHKLPRVRANLIIDNQPHSAGNKAGIKDLYSAMMGTGTTKKTKDEFNQRVDFLGANVSYGAESASARSLSKFFPEVLGLMAEGLLHPKFTQEEFEDQKNILLEGLKSGQKSAAFIASNVSAALAYGKNHPYGEFATEESVNNIKLNDVKSYYQNYISPKNAYLVVVGDVDVADVKKLARKHFGSWSAGTPPNISLPKVQEAQYTQVNFIDLPNAVQSVLRLQNTIDLQMKDEDYFPVLVANQILGGSFGSYLNMNLREANGYTYGVRSNTGADKYASRFVVATSVRNAVSDSAIVESLKEINKIKSEKVSFEALNNAKNKFAGDFVLRLENPGTIADYAVNIETRDLSENFYKQFLQKINAVTPEDIMRVANKYYKTDNMQLVVVGKGSEVAENLENIKLNGKKIPVRYYDKYANLIEKPEFNKEVPEGMTVKDVYDAYIKAIGGEKAVKDINNISIKGSASVQGNPIQFMRVETADGKIKEETTMNGMVLNKNVFNGESGYRSVQGQKMQYTEEDITEAEENAGLFIELKDNADAKLIGIESVNGEEAYVVQESEDTKVYYNTNTGLKVQEVNTITQAGQTMTNTTQLGNYKAVDGVKVPHTLSMSFGPQSIEMKIDEVKVNQNLTAEEFE